LLVETWHATYDAIYGAAKVTDITNRWHSEANLTEQIRAAAEAPAGSAQWVAEEAGQIIATIAVRASSSEKLSIGRLYVLPEAQGRGLGERLMFAVLARFPAARIAELDVEPENSAAIRFYARLGFRVVRHGSACGGDQTASLSHHVLEAALPLLRPARDADAQDLFGLITLCFAEYPGCYTDPHGDLPDLVKPGHWKERRAPDGRLLGGEFFVVEDPAGRVCASIALDFPEIDANGRKSAEIHRLYVRPDCRGRGLAQRLTEEVEANARAGGASRMILWSDTRFGTAHRLYERLGYRRGMTRALGDISGSIEYFFEKTL
jgi:ribosomal protein S18 acetylase RimI-like enzyme